MLPSHTTEQASHRRTVCGGGLFFWFIVGLKGKSFVKTHSLGHRVHLLYHQLLPTFTVNPRAVALSRVPIHSFKTGTLQAAAQAPATMLFSVPLLSTSELNLKWTSCGLSQVVAAALEEFRQRPTIKDLIKCWFSDYGYSSIPFTKL